MNRFWKIALGCAFLMTTAILCSAPPAGFPVTVKKTTVNESVETRDISFPVEGNNTLSTHAYLVRPQGSGSYAGILYFHLLGPGGSRRQFLDEARRLASRGVISVLIQGRTPWSVRWKGDVSDNELITSQMNELSRALAVLRAEPGVDPQRIAVVGHDYGAMFLIPLILDNPDLKAGVLMAFTGHFGDWITYFPHSLNQKEYTAALKKADPLTLLSRPRTTPLFLQFARKDKYVSEEMVTEISKTAAQPCEWQWVETDIHEKVHEAGAKARLAWLLPRIGIK
jgi:dienelactone hydrolase